MKRKIHSVIMGGGRGTRLHPLTKLRCKPAVPLAGKFRLIDIPISNCINSDINQIYILTQFHTASLHKHIQDAYKFDNFGGGFVEILSAEQKEGSEAWYQGTADAVRQNLHHFGAKDDDLFVILSGDQLYSMDIQKMIDDHDRTGADITIAAKPMEKSTLSAFGLIRVNDDQSISEFVEKPEDPAVINSLLIGEELKKAGGIKDTSKEYGLASMGIYVFNAKVLTDALQGKDRDFGKEVIPSLLGKKNLTCHIFEGYWEDIGTIKSFFEANIDLTDENPEFDFYDSERVIYTRARNLPASKIYKCDLDHAIISGGCFVHDAKIKRSIVGIRSNISKNVELDHVVLMGADYYESPEDLKNTAQQGIPTIGIGENTKIKNAIIDKNARIGKNVILSPDGLEEGASIEGVVVRDGIIVVIKDSVIPDGTVFGNL
jgi:glucose-1-phosphate adenylyltransferase